MCEEYCTLREINSFADKGKVAKSVQYNLGRDDCLKNRKSKCPLDLSGIAEFPSGFISFSFAGSGIENRSFPSFTGKYETFYRVPGSRSKPNSRRRTYRAN